MPDERRVATQVKGWKQASLFSREQLRPFVKRRWKWIMQRLREESRQTPQECHPKPQGASLGRNESKEPSDPKRR